MADTPKENNIEACLISLIDTGYMRVFCNHTGKYLFQQYPRAAKLIGIACDKEGVELKLYAEAKDPPELHSTARGTIFLSGNELVDLFCTYLPYYDSKQESACAFGKRLRLDFCTGNTPALIIPHDYFHLKLQKNIRLQCDILKHLYVPSNVGISAQQRSTRFPNTAAPGPITEKYYNYVKSPAVIAQILRLNSLPDVNLDYIDHLELYSIPTARRYKINLITVTHSSVYEEVVMKVLNACPNNTIKQNVNECVAYMFKAYGLTPIYIGVSGEVGNAIDQMTVYFTQTHLNNFNL